MAGIGFELNKIVQRRGYTSLLQAYAYAGLIGSGPWLMAVISLGLLGTIFTRWTHFGDVRLFFVSISVIYGFTLVLTGPIQMVLTRYTADQEFTKTEEKIFPAFVFSLGWTALLFGIFGFVFFFFLVPGPEVFRLSAAFLMVIVASIWITGIFLTAMKNYKAVLWSFALGGACSFAGALALGQQFGLSGAMFGFAFGHLLLLVNLISNVYREVGNHQIADFSFLRQYRTYWDLALGGLLYNLGMWIDKFLFWWMDPAAEVVGGILRASPIYDRVVYFSFLTAIPGMAVFLLKLETEFAARNHEFFQLVLKKGTLSQIEAARDATIAALREGFLLLVKIQGLFTLLLLLSSGKILPFFGLSAVQAGVFQIALLGIFLLVLFMAMLTVLYYLDKRRDALVCCAVFAGTNLVVTAATIFAGQRWFGLGFLVASAISLALAATRVNYRLANLDYETFTSQPIHG